MIQRRRRRRRREGLEYDPTIDYIGYFNEDNSYVFDSDDESDDDDNDDDDDVDAE